MIENKEKTEMKQHKSNTVPSSQPSYSFWTVVAGVFSV